MNRAGFVLWFAVLTCLGQSSSVKYIFKAQDAVVEMLIDFPAAYSGKPLMFYTGPGLEQKTCYAREAGSEDCPTRFVGAMAVVKFSVRRANGRSAKSALLREQVTLLAQSPQLPPAAPVSVTAQLVNGIASDIQLFGFDEASLGETERERERRAWKPLWKLYRQELFLDRQSVPFAVIEWRHSVSGISIVSALQGAIARKEEKQP